MPDLFAIQVIDLVVRDPWDLPFALLYTVESCDRHDMVLRGSAGIAEESHAAPRRLAMDAGSSDVRDDATCGAARRPIGVLMVGLSPRLPLDRSYEDFLSHLVDAFRISRGAVLLRREQASLSRIVESAIELKGPQISEAGHRVALSLPARPCEVLGDALRLTQIIASLLDNAARYTPNGGSIEIRVHCDVTFVSVTVRDNGMCIEADALATAPIGAASSSCACPVQEAPMSMRPPRALRHQQELHADIVIPDLNMPYVNGFEVARTIRASENLKNATPARTTHAVDHLAAISSFSPVSSPGEPPDAQTA